MKAQIQDPETLGAIRASDLASYLRSTGWLRFREFPERMTLWRLGEGEDAWEAAIPAPGTRDFAEAVAQLLKVLADAEHRSQLEIFRDVSEAGSDVVRLPLADSLSGDGTLAVERGVAAIEASRDLVLAAACATVQKRPAHAGRRPAEASEYMNRVRLGQTEVGSFVLTIVSPVTPRLLSDDLLSEEEQPFERRVLQTLASGVAAATAAAKTAATTEDLAPFRDVVEAGVSANLCESLATLVDCTTRPDGLELGISWARNRPLVAGPRTRILVPREVVPTMREAARLFRQTTPRESFELEGQVYRLERSPGERSGRVFLNGLIDGKLRGVCLQLEDAGYQLALRAHDQRQRLACVGELVREGKSYELRNARSLMLLAPDAE
jgi:hypothetical protein